MIFRRLGLILNREGRRGVAPSKTLLPPRLRKERGTQGVRLIHKNQRGFTLIELLVAIAITGLITGGITMTIFQVFSGNTRTSNHMTAVRQVQNAGYWVSHDAQMAQSVVITGLSGLPLTLTWTEWDGMVNEVTYNTIVDSELRRSQGASETLVAQYIDSANCEFSGGSAFSLPDVGDTFTITDDVGGDSGTITVTAGSISVTLGGTATYDAGTGAWSTPGAGDTVVVAAAENGTAGSWTATTGTATAAITTDEDEDATLADGGVLILTVTATVQEQSETRVYEVIPRPGS